MPSPEISARELPPGALLAAYAHGGAYTDCYAVDCAGEIDFPRYVAAFYTSPVFRIERLILRWAVNRPSTDAQAQALAAGSDADFAAWRVEGRARDQLLLCDYQGRTRSWLMVAPLPGGGTRLYFGSAVVPVRGRDGQMRMGGLFRALLGFHRLYSHILLRAAASRASS